VRACGRPPFLGVCFAGAFVSPEPPSDAPMPDVPTPNRWPVSQRVAHLATQSPSHSASKEMLEGGRERGILAPVEKSHSASKEMLEGGRERGIFPPHGTKSLGQ
jgi:hypothetical protein